MNFETLSADTKDYLTSQSQWEKCASIRTRPQRHLKDEETPGHYFPPSRQPIIAHPLVCGISEDKKKYLLAQSLFKYMSDIAHIETDIINTAAQGILRDKYAYSFPFQIKYDALSILIDESYHAYVAMDFMRQVAEKEDYSIIDLPNKSPLSVAIELSKKELSPTHAIQWELIAVGIAEHALTNDLIAVAKSKDVCRTFFYIMHDHALDEKRHANFFEYVLKKFWTQLTEDAKEAIAPHIPRLISTYNSPEIQADFDKKILKNLGFNAPEIKNIIDDTHYGWNINKIDENNIISNQMISMLKRAEIFSHPTVKQHFSKYGIN